MQRESPSPTLVRVTPLLALLAALAALALCACGDEGTETTAQAPSSLPVRTTPVPWCTMARLPNLCPTPPMDSSSDGDTDGLEFVPWVNVQVTALGHYDDGENGLGHPHKVAIYETSTKKALVTVAVDSESELRDQFRYEPLTPLVLKAGVAYVVAWECWPDPGRRNPKGLAWAPEIRYVHMMTDPDWEYPEKDWNGPLWTSANFLFIPVAAASPSQ